MSGRGGGGGRAPTSVVDGQAPEATDFANYFCTYAFIYHQVNSTAVGMRHGYIAWCAAMEARRLSAHAPPLRPPPPPGRLGEPSAPVAAAADKAADSPSYV